MPINDEQLLYDSFERPLTGSEKQQLDKALLLSPELQEAHSQLQALRGSLLSSAHMSFSPGFTDKVMEEVAGLKLARSMGFESLMLAFKPVAVVCVLAFMLLAALNLSSPQSSSQQALASAGDVTIEDYVQQFSQSVLESYYE